MEILSVNLIAGQTQQFVKPGKYFEIIDSAGPIQVDFTGPNGNMTDNIRNALSGLYIEGAYSHFALTSATTQTVNLLLMETGRGGSRRQPGNVRVIDQAFDKTLAGSQFITTLIAAAGATQMSVLSIKPGAKTLAIHNLIFTSATAGQMFLTSGTGDGTIIGVAPNGGMVSKLVGGAQSGALGYRLPFSWHFRGRRTAGGGRRGQR